MITGKHFIQTTISFIFIAVVGTTSAFAELVIDSVYPSIGKMGENLEVNVNGSGFDQNTKLYMYPDTGNRRKILGSRETPGNALGVTVVDNMAFVADSDSGLQILDVSDPSQPDIIGAVDTPGQAWSVAVSGDTAFMADGYGGLQIIDVSEPSNPSITGALETPGYAWDIKVVENTAFVADDESGLQVIDVSDPFHPAIIGSADTPGNALQVKVMGNKAFVADDEGGLQVIDISDPYGPVIIGAVDTPGNAYGVDLNENTAFIADQYEGLQVIDIEDPANPNIIGSTDTPGAAWTVTIVENTALVADGSGGLQLIDINDLYNPFIIGSVETPDFSAAVTVSGKLAYVSDYESGLQVIDISDPPSSMTIGGVKTPGDANAVALAQDMACIADDEGLQLINVNNVSHPSIAGSMDTLISSYDIKVKNTIAYLACGLFYTIDISEPTNPVEMSLVFTSSAQDISIENNTAYIASYDAGLELVDVSDASNPVFLGSVATSDNAWGVSAIGDTAFVANWENGLEVIDVSDSSNPVIIGAVDTPGVAIDVAVANTTAYVAAMNGGLQIIDVSDRSEPKIISAVETPGIAKKVTVINDTAYVADGKSGIKVIDVSDPYHPFPLFSMDTPGDASDVAIMDDKAYVADSDNGMIILPIPYKIETITSLTPTEIQAALPSPQIPGDYNLRVVNGAESDELVGAVTFLGEEEYESHIRDKAIIIAGRENSADSLWASAKSNSVYAYNTLLFQGYSHESILFLCPEDIDVDGDGINDTDFDADKNSLSDAFGTWVLDSSSPASSLLVYMTGPGGRAHFQINPSETVTAQEMSAWLDAVEPHLDGGLFFIYDACLSGSFFDSLTPGTSGRRVIMTSTSEEEGASFLDDGKISFSYRFWNDIYKGYKAGYAFARARTEMSVYHQNALISNSAYAETVKIGIGKVVAPIGPRINDLAPVTLTLYDTTSATISAAIESSNSIKYVMASIIPPDFSGRDPEEAVTETPEVILTDPDGDGIYEGVYHGFIQAGAYTIKVTAEDKNDDRTFEEDRVITIVQTADTLIGDVNGDGSVNLADPITALKAAAGISIENLCAGADVNKDWKIGVVDAIILLRGLGGL